MIDKALATAASPLARLRSVHPLVPWVLTGIVLVPLPWLALNEYQIYMIDYTCVMILASVGLNIIKGFAGQVTVGHIGLFAIGAYSSAILSLNFGFPFWLSLPCAVAITAMAGLIVGIPSFRLEGAYLALVTLGLSESVRIFIIVTPYLGGTIGIGNIPAPQIGDFAFDNWTRYYFLLMPVTLLGIYCSFCILGSRVGRAFKALREDPIAAAAAGINVRRYKLLAFCISAIYAGTAGAMWAHMDPGYISPNSITLLEMVTMLLIVVLGGIGNIWGGIIGAIIVTIVHDLTAPYPWYQFVLYGGFIVITVLYMPKGIGGLIDRYFVTRRFIEARKRRLKDAT